MIENAFQQCVLFRFFSIINIDWRYQVWKAGVTFTDNSFLYSLWYFSFSVMGNFNNFFFAAHLLDVAVGFKTLRTILQSVTHNGKQVYNYSNFYLFLNFKDKILQGVTSSKLLSDLENELCSDFLLAIESKMRVYFREP